MHITLLSFALGSPTDFEFVSLLQVDHLPDDKQTGATSMAPVASGMGTETVSSENASAPVTTNENDCSAENNHGDDKPAVVDSEDCISPAEQAKLSGKSEPKKKGRPAKAKAKGSPKAKGRAKAKSAPKRKPAAKAKAASKAKTKAIPDAKSTKTAKKRRSKHDAKDEKNEETTAEDDAKDSKASSSHSGVANPKGKGKKAKAASRKPPAKKAKVSGKEEETNDQDPKQRTLDALPTVVRRKRKHPSSSEPAPSTAPCSNETPAATSSRTSDTSDEATQKKLEAKQRNARKSAAYRRAIKKAKDEGLNDEECKEAGKKVF